MGAVVGGLGSCFGACAGGCVAGCCCKVATAGRIDSTKGARMLLVYLQAFIVALALLVAIHPWTWIGSWLCKVPGLDDVGVCQCDADHGCWRYQMIYRVQCSGFLVFTGIALMAVSGCSDGAAHGFPVLKFMLVPLLATGFLFVPNNVFEFYGNFANVVSTLFIAAQAILLIDFGYTWNETWMGNSIDARRRDIASHGGYKNWQTGILVASAALFLGSLAADIILLVKFKHGWWVVMVSLVMSLVWGFVSILERIAHGNLLTSCVVMGYAVWLTTEALFARPGNQHIRPLLLQWIGLAIASISLVSAAFGEGLGVNKKKEALAADDTAAAVEEGENPDEVAQPPANIGSADDAGPFDKRDFITQSTIHATAVLYITVEIAPISSWVAFTFRTSGLIATFLLYGWTLVAPYMLKNRHF